MAVIQSYLQGQFSWVDLMTSDLAAAKGFYQGLLGWEAADVDTGGFGVYSMFRKDGYDLAGGGQMSPEMLDSGMPSMWNSYISVDDIKKATAQAESLGANIVMPPMEVMQAGQMVGIQDPTGANVFFWQPNEHPGAQLVNVPDTWVWNELMTRDVPAAKKFYAAMFGWEFTKEDGAAEEYWMFTNHDRQNGGLMKMPAEAGDLPPYWVVYFHVADLQAATEKVRELGGAVYMESISSSVGPIAICADPQSATFNVIQLTVPADE